MTRVRGLGWRLPVRSPHTQRLVLVAAIVATVIGTSLWLGHAGAGQARIRSQPVPSPASRTASRGPILLRK